MSNRTKKILKMINTTSNNAGKSKLKDATKNQIGNTPHKEIFLEDGNNNKPTKCDNEERTNMQTNNQKAVESNIDVSVMEKNIIGEGGNDTIEMVVAEVPKPYSRKIQRKTIHQIHSREPVLTEKDDTEDWNSDDSVKDPDFDGSNLEKSDSENENEAQTEEPKVMTAILKRKRQNTIKSVKTIVENQIKNQELLPEYENAEKDKEEHDNIQEVTKENILEFVVEENVIIEEVGVIDDKDNETIVVDVSMPHARKLRRERMQKRNSGKQYVTAKGKVVKGRVLQALKNCRMKCKDWLKEELRTIIFNEYWGQGSHCKRVNYINKLVTSAPVNTHRVRMDNSNKSRNITYNYAFEIEGHRRKVCKSCFQGTLNESEKFIRNCLKNKEGSVTGIVKSDMRGKCAPANKTSDTQRQDILKHIESFPKYESHYTRRVNDKKYLPSDLNLLKMYTLYCESYANPVGRKIYEEEFHKLKLAFKIPKTDLCHKCEVLQMQIQVATSEEEISELKKTQTMHHTEADTAYECKKRDKEEAKTDKSYRCYTFDLQQCLPTPYLETSISFYKRKYWTYNLTIHNCCSGYASCYLWHETIAMRGANEIASCLFKELMLLPPEVKRVTLYSDTCAGQNKNFHVAAMFLALISNKPSLEEINHKFMTSGHSHMECDSDHSLIEKQKKRTGMKISHPHDWATLIRCTNKKKPFTVVEMSQDDFFDFADLLKTAFVKKQKNSGGEVFKLHDCKWLRYTKQPGVIFYRHNLAGEEDFKELNLNRRGRPTNKLNIKKRYNNLLPIAAEKKEHLLELLPLVHEEYKSFYQNLHTKPMADTDPDLEDFNPEED